MIITKKGAKEDTIVIEEDFRAPKEKVFKAWTTPESLKKWFMAEEGVIVKAAQVSLYKGGRYFIETIFPGFDPSMIKGHFLLVNATNNLEYTWLTPALNGKITKVEVKFIDKEEGSKIHLTHGRFKNEEEMQLHIDGCK